MDCMHTHAHGKFFFWEQNPFSTPWSILSIPNVGFYDLTLNKISKLTVNQTLAICLLKFINFILIYNMLNRSLMIWLYWQIGWKGQDKSEDLFMVYSLINKKLFWCLPDMSLGKWRFYESQTILLIVKYQSWSYNCYSLYKCK